MRLRTLRRSLIVGWTSGSLTLRVKSLKMGWNIYMGGAIAETVSSEPLRPSYMTLASLPWLIEYPVDSAPSEGDFPRGPTYSYILTTVPAALTKDNGLKRFQGQ